jgi:FKBP-type peptidyl-prolyl cis-trans isomerase
MTCRSGRGAAVALLVLVLLGGCGGADSSTGAAEQSKGRDVTTEQPPAKPGKPIPVQSGAQAAKRSEARVYVPDAPLPKKLIVTDMIKGAGPAAKPGDELTVNFVAVRYDDGEFFESSWGWPKRFTFKLRKQDVIPGWVEGLPGMREGGRRHLVVPGTMAARFGVPPSQETRQNALVYVVDLIEVG